MNSDAARVVQLLVQALLLSALCGILLYYAAVPTTEISLASGASGTYAPNITDAVWFTVQTMTTTGYGSLPPEVWNPKLKWASVVLMLTATVLWTSLLGFLVNLAHAGLMRNAGNLGN